jgi:hypothetical protein
MGSRLVARMLFVMMEWCRVLMSGCGESWVLIAISGSMMV